MVFTKDESESFSHCLVLCDDLVYSSLKKFIFYLCTLFINKNKNNNNSIMMVKYEQTKGITLSVLSISTSQFTQIECYFHFQYISV